MSSVVEILAFFGGETAAPGKNFGLLNGNVAAPSLNWKNLLGNFRLENILEIM